ncbi:MAG: class I SAM-dependent methyltransferase [Chlamydiales bacterium]|nr:class I SAM-dependent methyltransferase [Chlamydiales bacterium]
MGSLISPYSKPHLEAARNLWRSWLKPGDLVIDATVGNGHDAFFVSELGCEVIGLDIQQAALEQTKKRFGERKIQLFHQSHSQLHLLKLPRLPKLIIYNLGYLPGGDKQLTTLTESTLQSVEKGLERLDPEGALCITCYPGHDEGLREETALLAWASLLSPEKWLVCHHRWLNRNRAPSLLWIAALQPSSKNSRK